MKTLKYLSILASFATLSSCANPFDLKAIEKQILSATPTSLKASTNFVSGGSPPVVTVDGYKVTNSLGVFSTLPIVTTTGGYRVSTSLNSD